MASAAEYLGMAQAEVRFARAAPIGSFHRAERMKEARRHYTQYRNACFFARLAGGNGK